MTSEDLRETVDGEPVELFFRRHLAGDFLLWSPNIQSEAFLNWDRIWATRAIPSGTARPFPVRPGIDEEFTFVSGGREVGLDELFDTEYLSGVVVVKDGELRYERYARGLSASRCWQSSSMVKSLGSILVGIAIQDGFIPSVDVPVTHFVHELRGTPYEHVTIKDLLHMASGIDWMENTDDLNSDVMEHYIKQIAYRTPGYVLDYLKTRKSANPPGTQYYYNTGDTLLLSYVLSRATASTVSEYCSEKFWKPLGCEQDGYFILESDGGQEVIGSCCGATARDYARWGTFMLSDGVIDGKRIVPEGWVAESTSPTAPNFAVDMAGGRGVQGSGSGKFSGYGYLWWCLPNGDYMALGSYGQWITVSPANNSVIVMLGAVARHPYMSPDMLEQHRESSHLGSQMRSDFMDAVLEELK